jgi:dUTP pyrophosphatase
VKHLKVKYFDEACKIQKIEVGDWIDLRCADWISMDAGDFKLIPL